MPRPEHLPTPASSTEIRGKDGSQFSTLPMNFELPPPAVMGVDSRPSSATTKSSSASSYQPTSPTSPAIPVSEVVKVRRRSSNAQAAAKDAFALPPPPTRSRKIIQMKPKGQLEAETSNEGIKMFAEKSAPATPPKKKQPSSTSVAGRKIARKTAHSLIERRRRSKMNEEFGVLKDMIPACTGEMHKLAILQASIDYVRYLEDCVTKLKAENNRSNSTPSNDQFMLPPAARGTYDSSRQHHSCEDDEDVEMDGTDRLSPPTSPPMQRSHQPSVSPALLPQDSRDRHNSYSSTQRHYSFSNSTATSPALLPGKYDYARSSTAGSTMTSPALLPQRDLDQEATAALLMLNTDRRNTQGSSGRGMSVKDLLST